MKPKQVLIAFDQLINTLFNGWADETLSSRAHRWARKGKHKWVRNLLDRFFFWEACHCERSYESERERRHFPPELR